MGKWWCVADRLQPTHAWDRLSAGTPAHAVTAVTAVPRRDPATACRSLGGHGPAVTAATAVTVGIHIARAVTAVIIVPGTAGRDHRDSASFRHAPVGAWATVGAVTAVTGRAFVTRPGGGMGHRGRRDRRDRGSGVPLGIAVAALTTVTAELRPARDVHLVGCWPSLSLCSSRWCDLRVGYALRAAA
jgi:hypothetical protein